jgi:hypothetical protein
MSNLQVFESLRNDKGLVPMVVTDNNYPPYRVGQIYGFLPDQALLVYKWNAGYPVRPTDSGDPERIDVPDEPLSRPITSKHDPRDSIQIPSDWQELNMKLRLMPLARQILGAAIMAELGRRNAVNGNPV